MVRNPHPSRCPSRELEREGRSSPSLLFSRLSPPISLSRFSSDLCSRACPSSIPFSGHAPAPQSLSCSEGPKTDPTIRGGASAVPKTGGRTVTAPVLLATLLLTQARMPMSFLATWHTWACVQQLLATTPRSFSAGPLEIAQNGQCNVGSLVTTPGSPV